MTQVNLQENKSILIARGYDVDHKDIQKLMSFLNEMSFGGKTHLFTAAVIVQTLGFCLGRMDLVEDLPPIKKWKKGDVTHLMAIADTVVRLELIDAKLTDVDDEGEWVFFPYIVGYMKVGEEEYLARVEQGVVDD